MKKICLLLATGLFTIAVHAQRHGADFGIKAGVNVADVKVDDGDNYDPKVSFHVGGLAHIHLTRYLGLQPEIMFSGQGAKDGHNKLNLGYVNIPVLLQYMTGTGFRLQTGPQVGYLLSAKYKNDNTSVDLKDDFNKIDFTWAFGASYVTNSGFGIDARYNLGLSNISESDAVKVKNRVFQVGVFYLFNVTPAGRVH